MDPGFVFRSRPLPLASGLSGLDIRGCHAQALIPSGLACALGSNDAGSGQEYFLVSLECYCADVVSILSPPLGNPMFIWQYITVRGQPRTGEIIFDDLLAVWPSGIVGCHSRFACLSLPSLDVGVELKMVIRSLSFL